MFVSLLPFFSSPLFLRFLDRFPVCFGQTFVWTTGAGRPLLQLTAILASLSGTVRALSPFFFCFPSPAHFLFRLRVVSSRAYVRHVCLSRSPSVPEWSGFVAHRKCLPFCTRRPGRRAHPTNRTVGHCPIRYHLSARHLRRTPPLHMGSHRQPPQGPPVRERAPFEGILQHAAWSIHWFAHAQQRREQHCDDDQRGVGSDKGCDSRCAR